MNAWQLRAADLHDELWRLAGRLYLMLGKVRELASRSPGDPLVRLVMGEAERLTGEVVRALVAGMYVLWRCGYVCERCRGLMDPRRRWDGRCPWCGRPVPQPRVEAF